MLVACRLAGLSASWRKLCGRQMTRNAGDWVWLRGVGRADCAIRHRPIWASHLFQEPAPPFPQRGQPIAAVQAETRDGERHRASRPVGRCRDAGRAMAINDITKPLR
jgi:hypothetical protein